MNLTPRLKDSIFQILADPYVQHHWSKLVIELRSIYIGCPPVELKEFIINEVSEDGVAGMYKDSFLGYVFDDPTYVQRLGNRLLNRQWLHADRVMAYINYEVAKKAVSSRYRDVFEKALCSAAVPELVSKLAEKLDVSLVRKKANRIAGRIAVYASNICTEHHPPTQLALSHVRLLAELGYEVQVFSVQENHIDNASLYFAHGGFCGDLPFSVNGFEQLIGKTKTDIKITDPNLTLQSRWQQSFQLISDFAPELIFFVGYCSPLIEVLSHEYPILAINVFSSAPIVSCHTWLCADPAVKSTLTHMTETLTLGLPYYYPNRVIAKKTVESPKPEGLNLDMGSLILMSVGARLELEIEGQWATSMRELLNEFPQVRWILVGGQGKIPPALTDIGSNQLISIAHVPEILNYLAVANIYVNPPRLGGGFSVADAMSVGLPVITYRDSDGGSKVGEEGVETEEAYFRKLRELIRSESLRHQTGRKLKDKFQSEICVSNGGPALAKAIEQCHSEFAQRAQKKLFKPVF